MVAVVVEVLAFAIDVVFAEVVGVNVVAIDIAMAYVETFFEQIEQNVANGVDGDVEIDDFGFGEEVEDVGIVDVALMEHYGCDS